MNLAGQLTTRSLVTRVSATDSAGFYARDARLARILAMALCLCLSQLGVLSKCMDGSSFWHVGFFQPILRKFGYLQNAGNFLWNVVLNSGLCRNVLSTKVDAQSVINWTVVDQLS